ncbi:hypothetical protein Ptr902_13182 [Pyrenophora tritici-repentis]|nr:hypothetical protein L13192_12073 [Pyrenophora tritici-repentis]KAI2475414.1 hypothetical protein Ptr902_13182 [Pyrenophora tritici-repentis]
MYRIAFICLGVFGAVMLQGLLAVDGGLLAILKTIYYGKFPSGRTMALTYTGLPVIDQFANIQVAFWDPVVSVTGIPWLQACMLCASLQTAGVWVVIESLRKGYARHWIIRYAPLYVFLWQGIGTAIFLPFYFMVELVQHVRPTVVQRSPEISLPHAMAVLPAAIFSLAQPFSMVFFPHANMTEAQKQTALAIYQFGPLAFYALITTFSHLLSSSTSSRRNADAKWVKLTYAVCGISSGVIHIACLYAAAKSAEHPLAAADMGSLPRIFSALNELFIPTYSSVSSSKADTFMTQCSLFFLQWDFIICATASALYCVGILKKSEFVGTGNGSSVVLLLAFLLACVVVSPGFTVSATLLFRESILRDTFVSAPGKNKVLEIDSE